MKRLILNEPLPEDLRQALDREAAARDITLNDAASHVLAEHYEVDWKPSGFSYRTPTAQRFKLRVSEDLHREIRMEAARDLLTIRGVTLNILSARFETEIISPQRRARSKAV